MNPNDLLESADFKSILCDFILLKINNFEIMPVKLCKSVRKFSVFAVNLRP